MARPLTFLLGVLASLSLAAPAAAADLVPRLLAPSVRTLEPPGGARCATTTFRTSVTGLLDVRLRGSGDWDLVVRDADRRRVAASRGFGGRELVQGWVRGGRLLVVEACRRAGAGPRARVTLRTQPCTSSLPPKLRELATRLRFASRTTRSQSPLPRRRTSSIPVTPVR